MQGITIGTLLQHGLDGSMPLPPKAAEDEYRTALSHVNGEQYELLPPSDLSLYTQPAPLYTVRHVLRQNPTHVKILGIYYIVEGVIYKSPSVRSLMKTNVTRVLDDGLSGASHALSVCARYQPSLGYLWVFENNDDDEDDNNNDDMDVRNPLSDPVALLQLAKRRKRRKILDTRPPGQRTAAEEEGIRASEAMDQILVRLSKSSMLVAKSEAATVSSTKK